MGKTAFLFPGQGSQEVGMAKDLAEDYQIVEDTFAEAKKVLEPEINIKELAFSGPEDKLTETENTQPAILTASVAILRLLEDKGIKADYVAGHSLGEYSALVAAGVVDFASALKLVRKRGLLMRDADPEGKGTMAAIIGLDDQEVEEVCQQVSEEEIVQVANYNCPGQVVISGTKSGVDTAIKAANDKGAKKAISLNVSGAFHSSLMEEAGEKLADELDSYTFKQPEIPIVTNIDANLVDESEDVKAALVKQISGSVRWTESIKRLIDADVDTFIEVGPGRVLKGFMRRIDRSVTALNVGDQRSLKKTMSKL